MKRIFLITIGMVLCFSMTACTSKQEATQITEENVEVSKNRKEVEVMASTVKTDNEEETIEIVVGEEDEIISDVDVNSNELTMDDMDELLVGVDVPFIYMGEGNNDSLKDFNNGEFKILFPKSMYHSNYTDGGIRAQLETIDFIIECDIRDNMEIPTSASTTTVFLQTYEAIDKYVLITEDIENSKYAYRKGYQIFNSETNTALFVYITINKVENYQEYGDSLVEEFVPVFEELLKSNLN